MAEHLHACGHEVSFALREHSPALMAVLPRQVHCIAWEDLHLSPKHCWVVPEGWPNVLAPGLSAGATCIVYVQNWAYLLSALPENTYWHQLPVHFLSVSDPVRWFVTEASGQDSTILRPAVDNSLFYPPACNALAPEEAVNTTLRIAWMPRKNTALARQIREIISARLHRSQPGYSLEWVEIHRKQPTEVALLLRSSHIFLSTGFPEGCPLPPLEAMASGCIVAGFSGMGGWDYMRQVAPHAPYAYKPWWPLREVPWSGNGFYVADADVTGAAYAVEEACQLLHKGGPALAQVRQAIGNTTAAYSLDIQKSSIEHIWKQWNIL